MEKLPLRELQSNLISNSFNATGCKIRLRGMQTLAISCHQLHVQAVHTAFRNFPRAAWHFASPVTSPPLNYNNKV
jgi:hypothetical protein